MSLCKNWMANVKSTTMETFNKNNNRLNAIISIIKARKKIYRRRRCIYFTEYAKSRRFTYRYAHVHGSQSLPEPGATYCCLFDDAYLPKHRATTHLYPIHTRWKKKLRSRNWASVATISKIKSIQSDLWCRRKKKNIFSSSQFKWIG